MEGLSIEDISRLVNGRIEGISNRGIKPSGASIDTRTIKEGDLFFALSGSNTDGHQFVREALEKGVPAAVVSGSWYNQTKPSLEKGLLVVVSDPLQALAEIAKSYRKRFVITLTAVTGSNGKTTVKNMIAAILDSTFVTLRNEGSFNNHLGVPLTLLALSSRHRMAVLEMGMSAKGEITALCDIASPQIGVITNVSTAHLQNFSSVEEIADAKAELLECLETDSISVLNFDDPLVIARKAKAKGKILGFSIENESDYRATNVVLDSSGKVYFELKSVQFKMKIRGKHNAYNALSAIAVGESLGVPMDRARSVLEQLETAPMRMEEKIMGGITIINDAYNANPTSVKVALDLLASKDVGSDGRRIAVLGDMFELGHLSGEIHYKVGRHLARLGLDLFIGVGPLCKFMTEGAIEGNMDSTRVLHFENKDEAISVLKSTVKANDVVLVKGSRAMKMEEVVSCLSENLTGIEAP